MSKELKEENELLVFMTNMAKKSGWDIPSEALNNLKKSHQAKMNL